MKCYALSVAILSLSKVPFKLVSVILLQDLGRLTVLPFGFQAGELETSVVLRLETFRLAASLGRGRRQTAVRVAYRSSETGPEKFDSVTVASKDSSV